LFAGRDATLRKFKIQNSKFKIKIQKYRGLGPPGARVVRFTVPIGAHGVCISPGLSRILHDMRMGLSG
jgi:hypothetical protein